MFLSALRGVLGDYAANTPFATFEASRFDSSRIPNDLAALTGKRLITASELREGSKLNEARIKALTGGDPITARFLHKEFFTFEPNAKIWLAVNHKPNVGDLSHAYWRRVHLIPFERQFSGAERDDSLLETLKKELSGILNWIVDGVQKWIEKGLERPEKVKIATDEYRNEMDILRQFLDEKTIREENSKTKATALYSTYSTWCDMNGEYKMSGTMFGRKMRESGYDKKRTVEKGDRAMYYYGIKIAQK